MDLKVASLTAKKNKKKTTQQNITAKRNTYKSVFMKFSNCHY